MRKTAWILAAVLAMGTSLSAQAPGSSTLVERPAQITVNPTPFERNKPVSAHVLVYHMPPPCADFAGIGTCSDNGKPVPCQYSQGLELRQYALKGNETVATEPKWESPYVGIPVGVDFTGAQPAAGSRTERDFESLIAPTAAGESLFMILYRYCDIPLDPTKGPGTDRRGTRLGSAKYKLRCTGHLKKVVCAYWPD